MLKTKKGDRVIAIRNTDRNKIYIYGYGTYQGVCKVTDEDIENAPERLRDGLRGIKENDAENSKIILDDDRGAAWGFMCWWGPIMYADIYSDGKEVVTIDLSDDEGGDS